MKKMLKIIYRCPICGYIGDKIRVRSLSFDNKRSKTIHTNSRRKLNTRCRRRNSLRNCCYKCAGISKGWYG